MSAWLKRGFLNLWRKPFRTVLVALFLSLIVGLFTVMAPVNRLASERFAELEGALESIIDVRPIGPSGSGKSTLLHIIGGMDRADAGEVLVAGETLHLLSPAKLTAFRRHKIGFVFQAFNLMPNLTALENVVLSAEFAGAADRMVYLSDGLVATEEAAAR